MSLTHWRPSGWTVLCPSGLAARPHPAPPTCRRAGCHRPPISLVPRTGLAAFSSRALGCLSPRLQMTTPGDRGTGYSLEKLGLHVDLLLTSSQACPFWALRGLALPRVL